MIRLNHLLAVQLAGLMSCAETSPPHPPAGMAVIDAASPFVAQDRIDHSRILAVNGTKVDRRQFELRPGRNTVRVGFRWPQGGEGQVDLRFYATSGTTYCVSYDPYPPYLERGARGDKVYDSVVSAGKSPSLASPFYVWAAAVPLVPNLAVRDARERQRAAERIDVRVIAYRSPQGIVREVRVWPDGRVDETSWARYAQMSPP